MTTRSYDQRQETISPFIQGLGDGRIPDELLAHEQGPSLLIDLLARPAAVVERLHTGEDREQMISGSATAILASLALIALAARVHLGWGIALRSAALLGFSEILAVAAAFGAIWATGVVVSARVPMWRLIPMVVTAVASGTILLVPLSPLVHLAYAEDPYWLGPLAVVGAFLIAGFAGGQRLYRLLLGLASRRSGGPLTEAQRFRIRIVGRMALTFLGFTTALGFWGFDALG